MMVRLKKITFRMMNSWKCSGQYPEQNDICLGWQVGVIIPRDWFCIVLICCCQQKEKLYYIIILYLQLNPKPRMDAFESEISPYLEPKLLSFQIFQDFQDLSYFSSHFSFLFFFPSQISFHIYIYLILHVNFYYFMQYLYLFLKY